MSKLVLFFGADLTGRNATRFLRGLHRRGWTLVALDSPAMAWANRAGAPYTLIDDWLDPEKFVEALETAIVCERNWFEPVREEFTVDGICWPDIDRYTTNWFWQNAILSLELAEAFKSRGCNEFIFFRNLFPRASIWNGDSDVCNAMWNRELSGKATRLIRHDPLQAPFWVDTIASGLKRLQALINSSGNKPSRSAAPFPEKSLVLVLGHEEALRVNHIVEHLKAHFPGKVAAVIGGPYAESSGQTTAEWGIPVQLSATWPLSSWVAAFPSRLLPRVDHALETRFLHGYEKALAASVGAQWEKPLMHLGFHFRYYCKYRWPKLHTHNFRFWLKLWEDHRPAALLVTSRSDTVFILACEAANRLGIPTFLIPHAGMSRYYKDLAYGDAILYGSRLQRVHHERSGLPASRLVGCKDLLARDEYPVKPSQAFSSPSKWRVLVLVEPTGEGPNLNKYTSPRAQLEALRAVVKPPSNIADRIDLAIKVHPNSPDLEFIEAAGSNVAEKMMPISSELRFALNETDLVVAINFGGTALIHCMLLGKPVISFVTEKEPMAKRPDFALDFFDQGVTIARRPEELWAMITRFFTEPESAEGMKLKAEKFARDNLDDSGFPSLADVISKALGWKQPTP
ncbi:MAG: hypothetical protein HY913_20235 [Desulfomonile tiedjei]|nr:hypothetical protein [Desulfomonile tiedjei]